MHEMHMIPCMVCDMILSMRCNKFLKGSMDREWPGRPACGCGGGGGDSPYP